MKRPTLSQQPWLHGTGARQKWCHSFTTTTLDNQQLPRAFVPLVGELETGCDELKDTVLHTAVSLNTALAKRTTVTIGPLQQAGPQQEFGTS